MRQRASPLGTGIANNICPRLRGLLMPKAWARLPGGATLMRPDEYSDGRLHLHPAARRLRAVAGALEEHEEEELLVR